MGTSLATREQRIVGALLPAIDDILAKEKEKDRQRVLDDLSSRARKLPAMLLRNGVFGTLEFLWARDRQEDDRQKQGRKLARLLVAGIGAARGMSPQESLANVEKDPLYPGNKEFHKKMATLSLERYLLDRELSVEVAVWLDRLLEGRIAEAGEAQR